MKRLMLLMAMVAGMTVSANAMSYAEASRQTLFLTDKMAYELNMTDDQYNAAYEVNLDYFLDLNNGNDIFGIYWSTRNSDLMYILDSYQYSLYIADNYFYRPVYWINNTWSFGIYSRYTNVNLFYRPKPRVFATYRGGHDSHFYTSRNYRKPVVKSNGVRVNYNPPARVNTARPQVRPQYNNRGNIGLGNKRPTVNRPATTPKPATNTVNRVVRPAPKPQTSTVKRPTAAPRPRTSTVNGTRTAVPKAAPKPNTTSHFGGRR